MAEYEAARKTRALEAYKAELRAEVLARRAREQALREAEQVPATVQEAPKDPWASLSGPPEGLGHQGKDDLDRLLAAFGEHVESTSLLSRELFAFGLRARLVQLNRFREGSAQWKAFWSTYVVLPLDEGLSRSDMEAFYSSLLPLDQRYRESIEQINNLLQRERS